MRCVQTIDIWGKKKEKMRKETLVLHSFLDILVFFTYSWVGRAIFVVVVVVIVVSNCSLLVFPASNSCGFQPSPSSWWLLISLLPLHISLALFQKISHQTNPNKIIKITIHGGKAGLFSFRASVGTTRCSKEKPSGCPRQEVFSPLTKVFWAKVLLQTPSLPADGETLVNAATTCWRLMINLSSRPSAVWHAHVPLLGVGLGGVSELRREQTGKPRISSSVPSLFSQPAAPRLKGSRQTPRSV